MSSYLDSVIVRDFRAIAGEIVVPLDAPVVLIHGANAAGKTSLMSAIELGLTGKLPAFERADSTYIEHLTNKAAHSASIMLKATSDERPAFVEVTSGRITGEPLLSPDQRQFFSERCYLGQATLSRLLEIYAPRGAKLESPLSIFVRDLLGVDRLDSLIDGLFVSANITRVRNEVPSFRELEQKIATVTEDLRGIQHRIKSLQREEKEQSDAVLTTVTELSGSREFIGVLSAEQIASLVEANSEERELASIVSSRQQLATIRKFWQRLAVHRGEVVEAENRASQAQQELQKWEDAYGETLTAVIARLERKLTNLPNPNVTEPDYAQTIAYQMVSQELQRLKNMLNESSRNRGRLREFDTQILAGERRLEQIHARTLKLSDSAGSLARALGDLLPHIHSNDCLVCGRDYSEISDEPLKNKVSNTVSALSEQAALLTALSAERSEAARVVDKFKAERRAVSTTVLSEEKEFEVQQRITDFSDAKEQLALLEAPASIGTKLRKAASDADRNLALVRKRDKTKGATRTELGMIAEWLQLATPKRTETVEDIVARLMGSIETAEEQIEERKSLRRLLDSRWRRLEDLRADISRREEAETAMEATLSALQIRMRRVEKIRDIAKGVRNAAVRAKATIVQRIFTKSLNKTWRELFVRLAPDEPFVPRFAVPDAGGDLKIELETLHRSAGVAGNPQTMLSAGNLNTAALALFLALNMSVDAKVPLLMLDDPVQSMDEVHTSQLAALLRMMSRGQSSRQIIIAVHERSLFEYLAFELAPSSLGDRLLTVELDRRSDGANTLRTRYQEYKPETAVA